MFRQSLLPRKLSVAAWAPLVLRASFAMLESTQRDLVAAIDAHVNFGRGPQADRAVV